MSDHECTQSFVGYVGTREWAVLDRALNELSERKELQETSSHAHIIGYLCKALDSAAAVSRPRNREEAMELMKAVQAEFRAATPQGRDLLAELFAERRESAANGD